MSEIVVTPSGPGAMETGLMIDEAGARFVVLTFKEPGRDPVLVTFTVPIFQNWLLHLNRVGDAAADELNWVVGDDG